MKKTLLFISLAAFTLTACGTSTIIRRAEVSYKTDASSALGGRWAVFSMMAAGVSSLNNSQGPLTIPTPRGPSQKVSDSGVKLPDKNSLEGFRHQANDILLAKLKQKRPALDILPPKQAQSIISQAGLGAEYLQFLGKYDYLGGNPEFLKKLGRVLECRYLMIPQLVIILNSNDNAIYIAWRFGRKSADYSISIMGQVWDLAAGKLIWSGRGSSSTVVNSYKNPPPFGRLAGEAAEALISILP